MRIALSALTALAALALCAASVAPAEVDARSDAISRTLRCVVCLNQSIADSDAALAEAMRGLVRERVEAGDTDAEVRAHMVARYGEVVLLRPEASARNAWLWAAPFGVLLAGGSAAVVYVRSRRGREEGRGPDGGEAGPLTDAERAELDALRA